MRIIALSGPVGLLVCGVAAALLVAFLCGADKRKLIAVSLLALPLTFVGILIHDALDLDIGISPLASTLTVITTLTGAAAGLVTSLWRPDHDTDD